MLRGDSLDGMTTDGMTTDGKTTDGMTTDGYSTDVSSRHNLLDRWVYCKFFERLLVCIPKKENL